MKDFEAWWKETYTHFRHNVCKGPAYNAWQAAQPKWLPIESAPKDGTEILVYVGNIGCIRAWWSKDFKIWANVFSVPINPSHYQPLPEPPKLKGK